MSFGWINVKDVANAHIQAFEVPSANKRYCLVERVAQCSDVVKSLCELYPQLQLLEKFFGTEDAYLKDDMDLIRNLLAGHLQHIDE
ncbi:hypothetical protein K1719_000320 [Acacia pycnantha]|nr:hypothetical protein K1719_000320 [Acacia pycnantha]